MERKQITKITLTALFAALIAAGAFIKIPLVPVPVTLTTLFVLLAAACLPVSTALLSVIVYLLIGAAGLPVFTSGGGIAAMTGPTGGYLFGMLPAAIAGSLVMKALESRIRLASLVSAFVSTFCLYLVGLPWLAWQMDISLAAAFISGFVPFIIGDTLKIIVTVTVAPSVRPRIKELFARE